MDKGKGIPLSIHSKPVLDFSLKDCARLLPTPQCSKTQEKVQYGTPGKNKWMSGFPNQITQDSQLSTIKDYEHLSSNEYFLQQNVPLRNLLNADHLLMS